MAKIPALLEHYSQHKQQQTRLSFGDFLFMHYIGDDANANDNGSDEQLPFKSSSENSENVVYGVWLPGTEIHLPVTIAIVHEKAVTSFDRACLNSFNSTLFRPPVLS